MAEETAASDVTEAPPKPLAAEASSPPHPDVAAMENALTRGDFRDARDIATRLSASDDAALREAGAVMLDRLRLDPKILTALLFTGALILILAGMYLGPR